MLNIQGRLPTEAKMTDAQKTKPATWIVRWKQTIAQKPVKPGVWRRKDGGYLARGRAKDPKTGKLREVKMVLPGASAQEAYDQLQAALRAIRDSDKSAAPSLIRFCDYSVSLLERKVRANEIRSAASLHKWRCHLTYHLLPAFGEFFMDKIRRVDILAWKDRIAKDGAHLRTANDWLGTLRVILRTWANDNELARSPIDGVKPFDLSLCPVYTEEEPNSLTVEEVQAFTAEMARRFPQHYAFVALGFATGLRPSSLRPLRRKGPQADVLWGEGVILVRRSHTRGTSIMERTKTGRNQRIALPPGLMAVLQDHAARLPESTDLLFPATDGGLRAYQDSGLTWPFQVVAKAIGLKKRISARCMRRTVQDVARAAGIPDVVTRAVTGHATETMQYHYSTVAGAEQRQGVGKIIDLMQIRRERAGGGALGGAPQAEDATAEIDSDGNERKTGST